MLIKPWLIHDCEVALFPAWQDGMPFRGPGEARGVPAPVFSARMSMAVSATRRKTTISGHSWSGAEPNAEVEYDITISFPDGAMTDEFSRLPSRLAVGGFHILVARFHDEITDEWSLFQWFYVAVDGDEIGESGESVVTSLKLCSSWQQESTGSGLMPELVPVVRGEVDWVCGSQRVTCLSYDPDAESWTSLPRNHTGDGSRYVNLSPVEGSTPDIALSVYLPRITEGEQESPALPRAAVCWSNTIVARIGGPGSALHHGLLMTGGHSVQAAGIVEPLMALPQSRMFDEPLVVFRYLRRVYAVLGHGVLAVPRLLENTPPPFSHDLPFRLAIPGAANPATGQSGLTLLPDGAWLDGTVNQTL